MQIDSDLDPDLLGTLLVSLGTAPVAAFVLMELALLISKQKLSEKFWKLHELAPLLFCLTYLSVYAFVEVLGLQEALLCCNLPKETRLLRTSIAMALLALFFFFPIQKIGLCSLKTWDDVLSRGESSADIFHQKLAIGLAMASVVSTGISSVLIFWRFIVHRKNWRKQKQMEKELEDAYGNDVDKSEDDWFYDRGLFDEEIDHIFELDDSSGDF